VPSNFHWIARKNGDIEISHLGKHATTLRGHKAAQFLADIGGEDEQEALARLTGNYKRGNERHARQHPRNR